MRDRSRPIRSDAPRTKPGAVQSAANNLPKDRRLAGYVYFVRCEGARAMKIGSTERDIMGRISDLQVGNPFELKLYAAVWRPNARAFELELHRRFDRYRMRGEWFECADEIRFFAQDIARETAIRLGKSYSVTWRNCLDRFKAEG